MLRPLLLFFLLLRMCFRVEAQDAVDDSVLTKIQQLPTKFLSAVSDKASGLEEKIDKKTEKLLAVMQKQESRMKKKLSKIDSLASSSIFSSASSTYKQLEQKLASPGKLTQYLPRLDTLATSIKFLQDNPQLLSNIKDGKERLAMAMAKVKGLETQLQKAEDVKSFIKERKEFLRQQLSRFGFTKQLKKLNKQVYYYTQQINEYKDILNDPKKIEQKAIALLSKTKLFQDFMKKNSFLASLFPMPAGNGSGATQAGFAGLQTRGQLNNFLVQSGMTTANPLSQLQGNVQDVQSQVTALRNKITQLGGGGGADLNMPDFKPNQQKTKSFFKRLEYGTSFQSQKANRFFPTTSDVGLSAGYKLNDKSLIGIAASYKIGWGSGFNNIRLSHQGIGLRSFIDWNVKGSLSISGGYEQNYRSQFNSIEQLRNQNAWQQSGLLGISKSISLKTKLLKKTKMQLLWDFLSYQQVPRTQPLIFRVGYSFN